MPNDSAQFDAQMCALFLQPLTIIGTLTAGFVLGYWGHFLNSKLARETRAHADKLARDARLASYEAFLLGWEQTIEKTDTAKIGGIYFDTAAALFRSRAAEVRRDFPDRAEFNRLDADLSRLSLKDIEAGGGRTTREKLADAIRPLIRYVQSA